MHDACAGKNTIRLPNLGVSAAFDLQRQDQQHQGVHMCVVNCNLREVVADHETAPWCAHLYRASSFVCWHLHNMWQLWAV